MTSLRPIAIGTRGSKLALIQTDLAQEALLAAYPALPITRHRIATRGDVDRESPLSFIDDKGIFVGEIEEALLSGAIDLAVHSAKDLPSELTAGLVVGAYLPRADHRDAFLSRSGQGLRELPHSARVGTSSLRRAAQVRAARPDVQIVDLRGNVDTRLRKLFETDQYHAIVLAMAGLERLGELGRVTEVLDEEVMLPPAGQGAIAIEVRANDRAMLELLSAVDDPDTHAAVAAERAFQNAAGAGCHAALGAYASVAQGRLLLRGMIGALDGRTVRGASEGSMHEGAELGRRLAEELKARGGAALLAALQNE